MNILAVEAAQSTCPPGCAGHLEGPVHISVEQVVTATAYPGENRRIHVSRELDSRPGAAPAVRIQGAGDAAVTPEEALQFGLAVIAEAFAAQKWAAHRPSAPAPRPVTRPRPAR